MERAQVEDFYHEEFGRILATVIRLVGDFHVAEEAVQDAFAVALEQWPAGGWPSNPRAWIISTARHKAIDALRRTGRMEQIRGELGYNFSRSSSFMCTNSTPLPSAPMFRTTAVK